MTSPAYTYLFADLLTNEILADLPCFGVHLRSSLNKTADSTFSIQLSTDYDVNDIVNSTIPGRTALFVDRDGVLVYGGMVWSRTYVKSGRSLQYSAQTFESLADKRFWTGPGDGGTATKTYTNVDQIQIVVDLWNYMQSEPEAAYGIQVPAAFSSSQLRNLVLNAWEYRSIGDLTRQLSQMLNGFDWNILTRWSSLGEPEKILRIGYPMLGVPEDSTNYVFDSPGNIRELWWPESSGDSGTRSHAVGAGEGLDMLRAYAENQPLLAAGWPLLERTDHYKNITDPTTLSAQAAVDLGINQPPITVPTIELITVDGDGNSLDPPIGAVHDGDYARLIVVGKYQDEENGDPRFPEGLDTKVRVVGTAIDPPEGEADENVRYELMQVVLPNG